MPERYGPWATPHTRFRRRVTNGTFERMRPKRGPDARLGRSRGVLTSKVHLARHLRRVDDRLLPPADMKSQLHISALTHASLLAEM
ncbi:hypothetical protein CTZ28_44500 [Streptomyces shenzhenensis]|uniref:Uncharacterized protein n=1 Tax=Streptomyces shenzhenensis TaxID=943815 RepID=A0A3M0ICV0_9ACTN|nr:hypothetical protein CTZ28_44500 [Streptomyces shenzhenensis]